MPRPMNFQAIQATRNGFAASIADLAVVHRREALLVVPHHVEFAELVQTTTLEGLVQEHFRMLIRAFLRAANDDDW